MNKKHFTEAKRVTKNTTKSKKGQAEDQRISGQAGRVEAGRTKYDDDGKKTSERVARYIGGKQVYDKETGVRHETLTRRVWLRAGAGNDTIKETEETEKTQ